MSVLFNKGYKGIYVLGVFSCHSFRIFDFDFLLVLLYIYT